MNHHERDALLQFLRPLMRTRAVDKDFVAETIILEACAHQPDALYLLAQRAMALTSALAATQARLRELQGDPEADATPLETTHALPLDRPAPGDRSGAWGRGLLAQAGVIGTGVGLGVAAGVVVSSLLLDAGAEDFLDDF